MTNILIVDDSRTSRKLMEDIIASDKELHLVRSIESAANAELVCLNGGIDLILMDVCTADDESGLAAAARIKKQFPEIKILIVTSMPEHSFITKAKDAGCEGFWYKEIGDESLVDVMTRVIGGEIVYPDSTPVLEIGNITSIEFTERELEVIREFSMGYTYEVISEHLCISPNTLKFHVKNLLSKTGYKNMMQLVVDAISKKMILPKF